MITKTYCIDSKIDSDCIEIFNNSSISDTGDRILKDEIFNFLNDGETTLKYSKIHPDKCINLLNLYKRFFDEYYSFSKEDMINFIQLTEEYIDFAVKADKMLKINERIKDLEKDFK